MRSVAENGRVIPLEGDFDVAVVGAGTAGVMAALGAARGGARVCLIERFGSVGGMVNMGLMGHFGNFFRTKDGRDIVLGPPRDLLARLVEDGATPYASLEEALRKDMSIFYRHEYAGRECLRMVLEARPPIELWLHSRFSSAVQTDQGFNLFFECKGRRAVRAAQAVDCTGEADVAASLGAAFHEDRARSRSWGLLFEVGRVALDRYERFIAACPASCPEWDGWLAKRLGLSAEELEQDRYWREWRDGRPRAWPFRPKIMEAVEAGDLDLTRALPEGGMVRYGWDGFWPEPWHGAGTATANVCMVTGLDPANARHITIAEVAARSYAFDFLAFMYWGDLHTHSAYSRDCARRARMDMEPGELMDFARRRAGLDFMAVADHHVPGLIDDRALSRECWERTLDAAAERSAPGEFLVFPGFEFSGPRGDTVFVFNGSVPYDAVNRSDWACEKDVWRSLAGFDFFSVPHFHGPGSLPEGEWVSPSDPANEPAIEILSDHGSYEREDALECGRAQCKATRRDRFGVHFLKSGYRFGFAGNSDGHKGHAGMNALTAVFAPSLEPDAIFAAYRARRVYATTNARIRLVFTANGNLMGSVLPAVGAADFEIRADAEGPLKRIDVFRNGDLWHAFAPTGFSWHHAFRVREAGPGNWYVRVVQRDNQIAISTPIWFE